MVDQTLNEYEKSVFSNSVLLRQKLGTFLKKDGKIELYASKADKIYNSGNSKTLKNKSTFRWWAFLFTPLFLMYRRLYASMF